MATPRPKARIIGRSGGRPKGAQNKLTMAIRERCLPHSEEAVAVLVELMRGTDNAAVRLAAAKELLDRAHGKVPQPIDGDGSGGAIIVQVVTGVPRSG